MNDAQFLEQLRATFRVEASEHVQTLSAGLLELEAPTMPASRTAILDNMFRAVHSLKGAARAVDYKAIESLCQLLEDIFDAWKGSESIPAPAAVDTLYRALDAIRAVLASRNGTSDSAVLPDLSAVRDGLRALAKRMRPLSSRVLPTAASDSAAPIPVASLSPEPVSQAPTPAGDITALETVRVAVTKLNAGFLQAEELLAAKLAVCQRVADLHELRVGLEQWRRDWSAVEPDVHLLQQLHLASRRNTAGHGAAALSRLLDFFERSMHTLKSIESSAAIHVKAARQDRDVIGKLVDNNLDGAKSLLLLPFSTISMSFPKIVRDLCRDQGKEAVLTILGEHIEIDKGILEELKDALIHLLRNSVDHGIETSRERVRQGKPSRATISLDVSRVDGNKVQVLLSDDGAGINTALVKDAALKRGVLLVEAARQLDEPGTQALIFRSEVSTSPLISEVSGRGLGLAIVREKVEKLGGEIGIESSLGNGATFRIILPAMRATFHGISVEVAGRLFVIPSADVRKVGRVKPDEVQTIEGRETIPVNGRALALVKLADVLALPSVERNTLSASSLVMIILGSGDSHIAFVVDAVLDDQEILVKPLRRPLSRVRNISGAAVMSAGNLVPILHVPDLLKAARKLDGGRMRDAVKTEATKATRGSILVAEDSITSRMLLKAILESAGYQVKTAVDGMEAFTLLRTEKFDLLVSDVEMPRLNGFDLTAQIRSDRHLASLPVVLVTALETREDRERGIDAGANAYIVKRSFDQSNLLDAVRRLV